eukprot:TRINITY_DN15923_c0_g1_i1.p1 TRINITY_DN15923_c0_g1~~TRINITY_DN15923_c0_g1_i1.p1  ORF type:complete len:505 (+),score=108.22 TRINITY_DN15923_c0_g1_i1:176-1690(+)
MERTLQFQGGSPLQFFSIRMGEVLYSHGTTVVYLAYDENRPRSVLAPFAVRCSVPKTCMDRKLIKSETIVTKLFLAASSSDRLVSGIATSSDHPDYRFCILFKLEKIRLDEILKSPEFQPSHQFFALNVKRLMKLILLSQCDFSSIRINGLQIMEDEYLLHLDTKVQNMYIDASGKVKLGDFGAAQVVHKGGTTLSNFSTTLDIAPPEVKEIHFLSPGTDTAMAIRCVTYIFIGGGRLITEEDVSAFIAHLSQAEPEFGTFLSDILLTPEGVLTSPSNALKHPFMANVGIQEAEDAMKSVARELWLRKFEESDAPVPPPIPDPPVRYQAGWQQLIVATKIRNSPAKVSKKRKEPTSSVENPTDQIPTEEAQSDELVPNAKRRKLEDTTKTGIKDTKAAARLMELLPQELPQSYLERAHIVHKSLKTYYSEIISLLDRSSERMDRVASVLEEKGLQLWFSVFKLIFDEGSISKFASGILTDNSGGRFRKEFSVLLDIVANMEYSL